jgi:hypothetical protein
MNKQLKTKYNGKLELKLDFKSKLLGDLTSYDERKNNINKTLNKQHFCLNK